MGEKGRVGTKLRQFLLLPCATSQNDVKSEGCQTQISLQTLFEYCEFITKNERKQGSNPKEMSLTNTPSP